jgi:uncharacterized OB-fold protein
MEIPRFWRTQKQRYRLQGEICPHCDIKIFPPRDICPNCRGETKIPHILNGRGEIYSFTTVYEAPTNFEGQAPYTIAMVKLEEGPMVTAQLTDMGDKVPEIGMPVEMVTRRLKEDGGKRGVIIYGYKFRPPMATAS